MAICFLFRSVLVQVQNLSLFQKDPFMENSSYHINYDNFLADNGGDRFNSHVILENMCLTGKTSSKKARHSKINTAQGPKDRRMRLSIDVAKRFFKLQDMLGFDRASNTIQWLLMKSKPAIQDLHSQYLNQSCSLSAIGVSNSPSSVSECEVLTGIDDQSVDKNRKDNKVKKRVKRVGNNIVHIDNSLAKETRVKARARARKRTTEKRNIKFGFCNDEQYLKVRPSVDQVINHNTNWLGPWIPFGEDQVQLTDQAENANSHFQFKQQIVGDSSPTISSDWSTSFLFNYQHNLGPCFEHQLNDFLILGNPWEDINN